MQTNTLPYAAAFIQESEPQLPYPFRQSAVSQSLFLLPSSQQLSYKIGLDFFSTRKLNSSNRRKASSKRTPTQPLFTRQTRSVNVDLLKKHCGCNHNKTKQTTLMCSSETGIDWCGLAGRLGSTH